MSQAIRRMRRAWPRHPECERPFGGRSRASGERAGRPLERADRADQRIRDALASPNSIEQFGS